MSDGRATWKELASVVGLSPPAVRDRVRRLESEGVIREYVARVSPEAAGLPILAYVLLTASDPSYHEAILKWARDASRVQECHVVAGESDYLLKVRAEDMPELDRYLRADVRARPGVIRSQTLMVLHTTKETTGLPLRDAAGITS